MMQTRTLLSPQAWGEKSFGSARLGDKRRTHRAVTIAQALAKDPAGSLPKQAGSEGGLHALYRFLHTSDVRYEELIQPHLQQTRESIRQHKRVLLIQDTTEIDYQLHPTTKGLGPIGNESHHGFLLQSVLAITPSNQEVLGVAHQEPFLRQPVPKGETKWARGQRERESQVWEHSVQSIGSPPPGTQWIHIGDRGSDIYTFMLLCQNQGCDFVIRAAQNRCVDLQVSTPNAAVPKASHHKRNADQPAPEASLHLLEVMESWPVMDQQQLDLPANQKRASRQASLCMSYGQVRLFPPRQPSGKQVPPLVIWAIHVWEINPPEGVEPLRWDLLTSVAIFSIQDAWERVSWYRMRWTVEDYHQCLKTGCGIEKRLLRDYESLRRLLGFLGPLAVRLLQVRALSRQDPDGLAKMVLPADLVLVVADRARIAPTKLTNLQCWRTIAKAGGYLGRSGDGPAGWKTLWAGWLTIQTLIEGVHLASRLSLDLTWDQRE